MTIKHRIEQLEKNRPPESKATDEWLTKYAEPFENDEEREEISKFLEMLDQATDHVRVTGKVDPSMVTVGKVDQAKDAGR